MKHLVQVYNHAVDRERVTRACLKACGAVVNIYLIPYTWMRHFAMAFYCATAGLWAWWFVLFFVVVIGPTWSIGWDGAVFLGLVSAMVGGASLMAEGALHREPLVWRVAKTVGAGAISMVMTIIGFFLWTEWLGPPLLQVIFKEAGENMGDASLVSLKYRLPVFALMGMATGISTSIMRRLAGFFSHLFAGLAAGLSAASIWFIVGYTNFQLAYDDLYLASAAGAATFGMVFGFFSWSIPDRLYAGWLRVVTEGRFARRIPIDGKDGSPQERFVGHYPRGLDLFLPAEDGVMELHVSAMVDETQVYHLRGLSIMDTRVERLLERVNLRYDPSLPTPKEVALQSGDRILMGPPGKQTVVEFIMLPREEQ